MRNTGKEATTMNPETVWQLKELARGIIGALAVLFAMYAFGLDFGDCPRC